MIKFILLIVLYLFPTQLLSQNIYELRSLSDSDWLGMSTDERLRALNISNNHSPDQKFSGHFGRNNDLYSRWGYDYYEMNDRYENFSFRGFENYNIIEDRRSKWFYNQFGERITKMTSAGQIWLDKNNDDGTSSSLGPSGYINSQVEVDGIWAARESTADWAISVIGAQALRTKLSPLTVSIPNMEGMKVDFQSQNYSISAINSLLINENDFYNKNINSSIMLRGGQIKRKFGAMTLGANFATMYNQVNSRDNGTNIRGTVHDYTPTPIYYAVRILDDSPSDNEGPVIYDVNLVVNNIKRPDIKPNIIIDDLRRDRYSAVYSKEQNKYFEFSSSYTNQAALFEPLSVDENIPKYLDYLYFLDYIKGWNSSILTKNFNVNLATQYYKLQESNGKPLQVNGNEYAVYLFDLGSINTQVRKVQVEITVKNDYNIQVSQIYTKRVNGGHDTVGDNYKHYYAEYWNTMAQANGNIKDGSNLRTLKIDFGYEVGNMIYGLNANFNYFGLRINGEFIKNTHYYYFADNIPGTGLPATTPDDINKRNGHRSSISDNAYYITLEKNWKNYGLNAEYFKMGKFYRPYTNFYLPSEIVGVTKINTRNDHARVTMIEDNDDNDMYPDLQYKEKNMGFRVNSIMDPDGVFPGNDLDYDGLPDNEKNSNNIPDYYEPFLMYDVDPDEFIFGDDFNNNNAPDFREDDIKYDTPYDLDRKGRHISLRYSPFKDLNLYFGSLRTEKIGKDNITNDDYFKINVKYNFLTVGNFFTEYRHERIHDNTQDPYVISSIKARYQAVVSGIFARYNNELIYDELEYRNSVVNKIFINTVIRCLPPVTVENIVRFEQNEQLNGTMYDNNFQPKDNISTIAMVNKGTYTKKWRNFTFSPGIKFRLYRKARSESLSPLNHYLLRIPIVYLKYKVSDKTTLTFGAQGLKGMELLYKDYVIPQNDYRQTNYIVEIENNTTYFGFNIWGGLGFKLDNMYFEKKFRSFENYKSSSFFAQIWLGY